MGTPWQRPDLYHAHGFPDLYLFEERLCLSLVTVPNCLSLPTLLILPIVPSYTGCTDLPIHRPTEPY